MWGTWACLLRILLVKSSVDSATAEGAALKGQQHLYVLHGMYVCVCVYSSKCFSRFVGCPWRGTSLVMLLGVLAATWCCQAA